MARDRNRSHIRDLEGENRQLIKKIKQLQRDNARLKKLLGREPNDDVSYQEESHAEEVLTNSPDRCERCNNKTRAIEMGFFKEKRRILKVCQNPDCGHRKVSYE